MGTTNGQSGEDRPRSLEQLGDGSRGLLPDLWQFMRENKKWWLLPILVCFALFGALLLLSGTGAAPFIYTLF
jgi:Family of unknown function (DUF5989)